MPDTLKPNRSRSKPWPNERYERILRKHHHAIGVTVSRWTHAEDDFRDLISACTLASFEQAPKAMLMHVGNQTLTNILRTIATEIYEHRWAAEHLTYACTMFDACRENRNLVSHIRLFPHKQDDGEMSATTWKETAHGSFKRVHQRIDLSEVRSIADEIMLLSDYLIALSRAMMDGTEYAPVPLPPKPPQPRRRSQTLPQVRPGD